jgi:dCTP deaminase
MIEWYQQDMPSINHIDCNRSQTLGRFTEYIPELLVDEASIFMWGEVVLISNRGLQEEMQFDNILIQPFRHELIQPASYDVILSAQFKVQLQFDKEDEAPFIDPKFDCAEYFTDVFVPKGSAFSLDPEAFVIGSTQETIALGPNICARLEGKSSLGRLGIVVHSTAGFIDPGFDGQITLELSNAGTMPVLLYPGMRIGQLCFYRMPEPTTLLYGSRTAGSHYQNQAGPTTSRSYENFKTYDVYGDE